MEKFDVILPAGGQLDDHFARVALTPNKALIKVKDYMVGMKSLEAARESGRLGRIVLVGPPAVQDAFSGRVDAMINDSGDLSRNIKLALFQLKTLGDMSSRVLILPTDLPFVDAKVINDFLDLCPEDAALTAPLISKAEYLDRFPSASGTFAKLSDGEWTIGCAYLVNAETYLRVLPQIEQVIANRKNVFKLAKLLGMGFLWKVLTKSIGVQEVVKKIEAVVNCKVVPIRNAPAELAFDIDDIVDYEYALANR